MLLARKSVRTQINAAQDPSICQRKLRVSKGATTMGFFAQCLLALTKPSMLLCYSKNKYGAPTLTEFLPQDVTQSLLALDLVLATPHSIPEIPALLNQTVLFGGKRLRPALCFMVGEMFGIDAKKMSPFARAAEFTHSASLAHDDVLDNAKLRRNSPTLFAKTSASRAVLAGDLLLARVMVELANEGDVQIIRDLALVVEDLVNGEWLQLHARGRADITHEHLLEVSRRKTASLMSWSCRVAARLAPNSSEELIEACTRFGKALGVAFQMVDDVIDFEISSEKDMAKDFKEGLVNFVVAEMTIEFPELKSKLSEQLGRGENTIIPWSPEQLEIAQDKVRLEAEKYLAEARLNLEIMKSYSAKTSRAQSCLEALSQLLVFLGVRNV